ncbi:bacillithiol biosynthesis cysteine-adding enzyme BshC [Salibacterium salarium]|uniref:Putative cysteine ligase BshC n=1 Tax=Salibacterium salarium TaxID=284579 RepID=A0A3R9WQB5_9BACI|nr:bacillithiol biosynthesis cysteine-adding enzyme BshC [Salibacterium salarium]RSL31321.1 bacillithiol biosynthesis cysteine-adding enzyme BshC [Salibacterium salarium]
MDVYEEYIPQANKFVKDYLENKKLAQSFFDYGQSAKDIQKRFYEISNRTYPKEQLYQHLYTYNKKLMYGSGAIRELEKLRDPKAVMMVTGQQAGILTGPLYTITKAVTVMKEAEAKQELLGAPVLPVFWIAGEDHDWEEVNHIFLPGDEKPGKVTYKGMYEPGKAVSCQYMDSEAFEIWWQEVLTLLPETNHTSDLYNTLQKLADKSLTITDFFAETMRWLFRDTGLIMLDANHPELRQLEKDTFMEFIYKNTDIRDAVKQGMNQREAAGYGTPEGFSADSAQFFYHYQKRQLLYENNASNFTDKSGNLLIYKHDLAEKASTHPEYFSTNALTRPLVQEQLLPVLGYVAGPGEINYWSLLQPLFHYFERCTPPLMPRMEITILPRFVQSIIHKEHLSPLQLMKEGAELQIKRIREHAKQVNGAAMAEELLRQIEPYHADMQAEWEKIAPSEKSFGETNWKIIQNEIQTFASKIDSFQEEKENCRIYRTRKAEQLLIPFKNPQERTFNILFFLNECGSHFVLDLMALEMEHNGKHKLIKL